MKKSSENDQSTGHFQSFFISFFRPPNPKSEKKKSRKSTIKKTGLSTGSTQEHKKSSQHDWMIVDWDASPPKKNTKNCPYNQQLSSFEYCILLQNTICWGPDWNLVCKAVKAFVRRHRWRVQQLIGRVLDSRLRGCGFEPGRLHCVFSLSSAEYWFNSRWPVPTWLKKCWLGVWDIKNQIKQKKMFLFLNQNICCWY